MREFGHPLDLRGQIAFKIKPDSFATGVVDRLSQDVYPRAVNELEPRQIKPHVAAVCPRPIQPAP